MPKKYDKDYKIEAVKLARDIGLNKAARELGIAPTTLAGWTKAARTGRLDMGEGSHKPADALSINEENEVLRKENRALQREIKRLKEENEFLEEASAFFAASRLKSTKNQE